MLFKEIPGNNAVKKQLLSSVKNNRISHAQLFSGNSGSAKLALAFAYARYLNCDNKSDTESCGKCPSCLKYNTLSHPDLHLIFPVLKLGQANVAVSDNFVNVWRDFILKNSYGSLNSWIDSFGIENKTGEKGSIYKDEANSIHKKLALKNFEAPYRVVLIWMPEQMNTEASNKLLKLFEEPPFGTVFLLVSEKPNILLPTIVSRLQKIHIFDFSTEDMMEFFKKDNLSIERIKQLRNLTDADLGKMIQLVEEDIQAIDLFDDFSSWMRLAYKTDVVNISKWVDSISTMGRKHQKLFLSYAIKMIRECLIFNFANKALLKTNEKESDFISKFAPFIHEDNSIIIIEELEKAVKAINRNANAKMLLFELSLQMIKFLKVKRKFAIN
jgi:DNA polymerase III subunit delta'